MKGCHVTHGVVREILRQHIEDASYLWSHRSGNLWSPIFFREHMVRLDNKLDANLEGLRIAGVNAVEQSLKNLMRWQTPEEAFVVTYILAHINDTDAMTTLEEQLVKKPTLSNGAAAALLWAEPTVTESIIDRWWFSEHDVLRQSAIPAAIIHPELDMETFIQQSAQDAFPGVRLKAYRAIGEWCMSRYRCILEKGIEESNIFCRAEAAASLALLGDTSVIHFLPDVFQFFQHSRLSRYLLIWSTLCSQPQFESWLAHCNGKEEYRSMLWALAFRGQASSLTELKKFIQYGYEPALATYIVSHITGVDLEEEGLLEIIGPEDKDDLDDEANPYEAGIPSPNVDAIISWIDKHTDDFPPDCCCIAGSPIKDLAGDIFNSGTQPQRWQAALHLTLDGKKGALPSLLGPTLS